ncbi:MAG TPA: T9SS type A sorting domain-containing protein, partial [Rhodothermia bacterium]|nr:T9SS type A sorting domain-containing protein [Rhodothermia bacterium]
DVPSAFQLEQNYPNPFNPSTAIRFTLPATEKVTLTVYDILGQRVATLLDGEQLNTGQHTVNFDASALASGVYTYRLQAGSEFAQSRRMLLVK